MTGLVCQLIAVTAGTRSDHDIQVMERPGHVLDEQIADAVCLNVFDCWNKSGPAKNIRPGAGRLPGHQIILAAAGQIVKGRGGFHAEYHLNIIERKTRKLDW